MERDAIQIGDEVWVWEGDRLGWIESGDIDRNECYFRPATVLGIGCLRPGILEYDVWIEGRVSRRTMPTPIDGITRERAFQDPHEAARDYVPRARAKWERGALADSAFDRLRDFAYPQTEALTPTANSGGA